MEFPDEAPTDAATTSEREEALIELRAWYKDWAETARSLIVRRDHLILMGLARRRQSLRGDAQDVEGAGDAEEAVDDDGAENGGEAAGSTLGADGMGAAVGVGSSAGGAGGASVAGAASAAGSSAVGASS